MVRSQFEVWERGAAGRRRSQSRGVLTALSLLAVVILAYAQVRSMVMRVDVAPAPASSVPGGMTDMPSAMAMGPKASGNAPSRSGKAICVFCAVANGAPLAATLLGEIRPSSVVSFVRFAPAGAEGRTGWTLGRLRARDPPGLIDG